MAETITRRSLVLTYITLMVLLAITVGSSYLSLGVFNILINIGIAMAKTALIMVFFMHLKTGSAVVRTFAVVGFFWLMLLIVLILSDYLTRG